MVDVIVTGKRKTAIAKALIRPGIGRVFINGRPLETIPIEQVRERILEPLNVIPETLRHKVDIFVKVSGGGFMGQADACRIAIGRALVKFTGSEEIKRLLMDYDRTILSGDPRRKEPKKFGGPGARRRFQKSYR
ncbi:30S ribosomal protein S9 [Candidatus Marsarchaeota G2 archaeon ECH_B_SAG-G16]|jgi:small subunit ribosomal protein S9|uniref:Small ribosomal subunit protein uS9 n=5 Tax=Candidatus Marsarchaeota TaxID=1978152 RepID=A0A2R6AKB5_9ARCH|nr:MAG: 30S ribosomal protein S9 [Candidatus Marsarchaeota G1 archaeon BE_D]PSN88901.1 MAG: 30S ribosomal protein S9 [Candidatus Marsarchaeota G1 archaeon OSP_C]PSN92763.1 MAG: 30S ribosomal protein S9 [Candidatus Marsarchaeota G1 archaeon OSP_B]PSO02622.1 MAG: 30S ribosomal protein S9 [Candidatus Marsarchaeota G2 archaeon ECH_B_SAG-E12]PSO05371.1 MAG: 30S ribosomal protein S9 [Candidatus Marsarchaeota G2 archaeon ECH_B_SAG-G16]